MKKNRSSFKILNVFIIVQSARLLATRVHGPIDLVVYAAGLCFGVACCYHDLREWFQESLQ